MCCAEKDLQYKIININIEFYNTLMDIITVFMNNVKCNTNNLNKNTSDLIKKKAELEIVLKNKLDSISTNTNQQTTGNLNVSDKLKILAKKRNVCNIILFLMGRTSFIRGYCSALLITCINKKYKKKLIKVIEKATKLENDLFDLHYCLC
jgi:hypothetical protein